MPKHRLVSLVHNEYQPSKTELEEPVEVKRQDGSRPTLEELAQAVLAPVEIRRTQKPE